MFFPDLFPDFRFSHLPPFYLTVQIIFGEPGIFPQHPAPARAVDENGGQLIGEISTNCFTKIDDFLNVY